MTDKKAQILDVALELFANDGYNATSTNKIAKKAGVSEGLIFKHFGNKKGLLEALMEEANQRLNIYFSSFFFEEDPKKVLRMMISAIYQTPEEEYDFWRLQFKLKWQAEYYKPQKMQPLIDKLVEVFKQLNYDNPEQEANMLNLILEGITTGILRDGLESQLPMKDFLFTKYKL